MLYDITLFLTVITAAFIAGLLVWLSVRLFAMMDDIRYLRQVRELHEEQGEELDELVVNQRTSAFPFFVIGAILVFASALLWTFVVGDGISWVMDAFAH